MALMLVFPTLSQRLASDPALWRDLQIPSVDATAKLICTAPYLGQAHNLSLLYPPATLTDDGCVAIASHCRDLQIVDLSWAKITNKSIANLVRLCPSIRNLRLKGTQITEAAMPLLSRLHLENLDISDIDSIRDTACAKIANSCAGLVTLDVGFTEVTESGVASILAKCKSMRSISLWGCPVGDSLASVIATSESSTLRDLVICSTRVTASGIEELLKQCSVAGLEVCPAIKNKHVRLKRLHIGRIQVTERIKLLAARNAITLVPY
ncbi:hypothetical protein Pelo_9801 [Pelomyxa schiedti]|nr:hypothetical protein Pelo_9801 [Pelomyxa schiedti]